MPDSDVNSPDGKRWFTTTQWSVVLAAGDSASPQAHEALETLCRTYWRPLYRFIRAKVRSREEAEDLTQGFFAKLLAKHSLRVADPDRGKFRSFLLTSLKRFMIDEWRKTSPPVGDDGTTFIPFDELQEEADLNATPDLDAERGYDRHWAMASISEARRLLREEHAASDRADYLQTLVPCVFLGESKCSYPELAARLNKSEDAIRQEVSRIRKRHRELLRQAVANTVSDSRDVDPELRHLFSIVNQ